MSARSNLLLKKIVLEHVRTAEPVGSLKLSGDLRVSSATVRNEMLELESQGYIYQPHTSAGRVPTAKGYTLFVEEFVKTGKISPSVRQALAKAAKKDEGEERVKQIARAVAEMAEETVIVAFDTNRFYYTGLSHLFSKPEFQEQARVMSVSEMLDNCEKIMPLVFELLTGGRRILIGSENPFGPQCSFLAAPLGEESFFGLLSPLRADYEKNLGIIEYIGDLLK